MLLACLARTGIAMRSRLVRTALPMPSTSPQMIRSPVVVLAHSNEPLGVEGIVVRDVMDMQRAGAFSEPREDAAAVALDYLSACGAPGGVVVDPHSHLPSRR